MKADTLKFLLKGRLNDEGCRGGEKEREKYRRKLENLVCAIRKISLLIKISSYSWHRSREEWRKKPNSNILNDFYDFSLFTSIFSLSLSLFLFILAIFQLDSSQRQGFVDIKNLCWWANSFRQLKTFFNKNLLECCADATSKRLCFFFRFRLQMAVLWCNFLASSKEKKNFKTSAKFGQDALKTCPKLTWHRNRCGATTASKSGKSCRVFF